MLIPNNLLYAITHEWVAIDGEKARVGLTDYAQDALGDVVFFNLPEVGAEYEAGDAVGEVESVKAVSDVYTPVGGVIIAVNKSLEDAPELVNTAPYDAWVFDIVIKSGSEAGALLKPDQYEKFCGEAASE